MSVVVEDLVKFYGDYKALDSISFSAEKGRILGLLGPNGAGKSTTMKIICGYLPLGSGKVSVCGLDTELNSLETRSKIGYLPENNPLYPDMYVKEFLGFIAEIYKVKDKSKAVSKVIEETGLSAMLKKKIGQLSKGYKQRVGIAQALVGNPEVLILDEPTSGLDPNQLTEIRDLILTLGKEKTLILSTHIMQEVESLCDQVLIINKGKIVANDSVESILSNYNPSSTYILELNESLALEHFMALDLVLEVKELETKIGSSSYFIKSKSDIGIREKLFDLAVQNNRILLGLKKEETDLTNIFQILTRP